MGRLAYWPWGPGSETSAAAPPTPRPDTKLGDRRGVLEMLSRLMGTSVEMISQDCGHVVPDSEDYLGGLLANFDAESSDRLAGCGN
jgi:hypothetical protein